MVEALHPLKERSKMAKKLTLEEFDKRVRLALEGPLPSGNGQKQLPPGALKALMERAKGRSGIK